MRRRTLIWIGIALLLAVGAAAGYAVFLRSRPDPVESAERIDLCEAIVLAALESPPTYQRVTALEMRQLVIPRLVAIGFRTDGEEAPARIEVATCVFANPFNSTYGRPGMIHAVVKSRTVAQGLIDAVAARWAANKH
jgi:hypothetical protein